MLGHKKFKLLFKTICSETGMNFAIIRFATNHKCGIFRVLQLQEGQCYSTELKTSFVQVNNVCNI